MSSSQKNLQNDFSYIYFSTVTTGFDWVNKADLYQFLEQAQQDEIAAEQNFRAVVQHKLQQP
ncbi:hypothetical protein [Acaryochloris sp. CCMEE 5410]|uniref:hypothetical protein n=1 Tax=Acaryochloris sp. CCMEE 5410 TaxID=310037 RepID=UPI0002484FA1|nr:hypothetical protein [Acaryochloris sp. CCMEE 5410]